MTYEEARAYLGTMLRFSSEPGLSRIRALLKSMNHPEKRLRFVHVAGTNGKGSISTMTASVLKEAGYKTGLFISPFVEDFLERIQINGQNMGKEEFAEFTERVKPHVERIMRAGIERPNEFEVLTAIAMDYYACKGVDIVVLEVGLGGRFDATNIIDAPEAAVIASISMDHTKCLGETYAQIAFEKCGIIKTGTAVIGYPDLNAEAKKVVLDSCDRAGVCLMVPDLNKLHVVHQGMDGTDLVYDETALHVPLLGEHQIYNVLTVFETIQVLNRRGYRITKEQLSAGIRKTRIPCRLEIVDQDPLCLIDGSHNPDGIDKLCMVLKKLSTDRQVTVIMGMLQDKQYEYCIPKVAELADQFIALTPQSERALDAQTAAKIAQSACSKVYAADDALEACRLARAMTPRDGMIVACGSLYMVGEIKRLLLKKS